MKLFPDTSFLCAFYRDQYNSPIAITFHKSLDQPLPVTSFLLLEFRQSVRLQIRLHRNDRSKGFPKEEGEAMLRALQSDLSAGIYEMVAPDWADVHRIADGLSAKYTEEDGHRLADILHVATALQLAAARFLTFDVKQRKLAEAEGMEVPV